MYEYKCVSAPKEIEITSEKDAKQAVGNFAALINREATAGWEFYSMEELRTSVNPGCLSALFGAKKEITVHNMLIFRKKNSE